MHRNIFTVLGSGLFACAFCQGVITGRVSQPDGSALVGATVLIEETPFGAMTDGNGEFVISGLEPGIYSVTARMVGRSSETVHNIHVEHGNVSRIDFDLSEDVTGSTVIRIVETRAHVLQDVPSTSFSLDLSAMNLMNTSSIIDIVSQQPGVMNSNGELYVRGGRASEVDYVLDGVSLRSPMDNRLGFDLPLGSLSSATLITGGMGIEYGNSMSGVVDLAAAEGKGDFAASVTGKLGNVTSMSLPSEVLIFSESMDRDLCRTDLRGFEFSLSGREPLSSILLPELGVTSTDKITFSLAGQMNFSGDGTDTRGNWSYNWLNDASGVLKTVYRPSPGTAFSVSLLHSYRENGWNQWAWSAYSERSCSEGIATPPGNIDYALPAMYSETQGAVINAGTLLGERAHLKVTLGLMRFLNWNRVYDPEGGYIGEDSGYLFWLSQYDPPDLLQDSMGFFRAGVHQNVWFDSKAEVYSANCALDWNVNPRLRLKVGIGGKYYDLYLFNVYSLGPGNSFLSLWNEYPHSANAYTQGSYRFSGGGVVTLGLRGDYFNANTSVFSPETGTDSLLEGTLHISPRASFSVPFGERSLFFVTYGHYFQLAPMNCYYLNTTFSSGAGRVVAGNPALEPELTSLYEVGIRHELDRFTDLALSFYSKEMYGLISTEDHEQGDFFLFSNESSHGTANGIEASVYRRQGSNLSGQIHYIYSNARGRYSSMLDRYNLSQSSEEAEFRDDSFLDWDQAHQAGFSIKYDLFPGQGVSLAGHHPFENSSVGISTEYGSGMPYTAPSQGESPVQINTQRRPFTMQSNMVVSKNVPTDWGTVSASFTIFNLFNRRNILYIYDNGLFHETGDPTGCQGNPRAWSPARHFLLTASLSW